MLPDMALVATGMALTFKMRSQARVALTFFGEGSTANGQWHEAMNFAGVHKLPVIFVCENNGYAISVPLEKQVAGESVAARARSVASRAASKTSSTSLPSTFTPTNPYVWARSTGSTANSSSFGVE